jgi:hypothetical protein
MDLVAAFVEGPLRLRDASAELLDLSPGGHYP